MRSHSGRKASSFDGGSEAPVLPPYLAHHLDLGFDDDDVSALIGSIEESEDGESSSPMPQLPAEILFHILGCVPIDHVLQWRLVCRGFRDRIDGPILYDYVSRATLIGCLGAEKTFKWAGLDARTHEALGTMYCRFDQLEYPTISAHSQSNATKQPKWIGEHAVFRIDDVWHESFVLTNAVLEGSEKETRWNSIVRRLQLEGDAETYGKMRWCLRLDSSVLDLDFPMEALRTKMTVDLSARTIRLRWKELLFQFLKNETRLKYVMDQARDSVFRFNHEEDCLREIRRQRLITNLDPKTPKVGLVRWGLKMLPPLFSREQYDCPADDFRTLGYAENSAIEFLIPLRREARLGKNEANRLRQVAQDRREIAIELQRIEDSYAQCMQSLGVLHFPPRPISIEPVPANPFSWTDGLRKKEEDRVQKWRSQQNIMRQIALLAESSTETASVPEDAFDELGSDI